MTEWGVFLVIAALVGFLAAVLPPIIKLNTSITKLTVTMDMLNSDMRELTSKNSDSHSRLWAHNEKQDALIADHDKRIHSLEESSVGY